MKALCVSALLIALLSVAMPVGADSVWVGTLLAGQPYDLVLDNGGVSGGKTIVKVSYLSGSIGGKQAIKFDILTLAAGERLRSVQEIPRGTRLISIEAAPPRNTTVNIEVAQGLFSFPEACTFGCMLVFDLQ